MGMILEDEYITIGDSYRLYAAEGYGTIFYDWLRLPGQSLGRDITTITIYHMESKLPTAARLKTIEKLQRRRFIYMYGQHGQGD